MVESLAPFAAYRTVFNHLALFTHSSQLKSTLGASLTYFLPIFLTAATGLGIPVFSDLSDLSHGAHCYPFFLDDRWRCRRRGSLVHITGRCCGDDLHHCWCRRHEHTTRQCSGDGLAKDDKIAQKRMRITPCPCLRAGIFVGIGVGKEPQVIRDVVCECKGMCDV